MRVCILTKATLAHYMGGMQVHCDILARGLVRRGHQVTIVTTRHPKGKGQLATAGFRVIFLKEAPTGKDSPAWLGESAGFIERHSSEFDVVFSESYAASGYARIRERIGIPYVCRITGFWSSYIEDQFHEIRSPWGALKWAGIKIPESFYGTLFVERPALRSADRCIAITKEIAAELKRRYRLSPERIVYIPNGVEAPATKNGIDPKALLRKRWSLPENSVVAMTSCVLTKQKGVQIAIEAVQALRVRHPELALVILGDGPYENHLKQLANRDSRIIFAGHVPNRDVTSMLSGADVFLCPTMRHEGLPFVGLEALGAGLPVVASKMGGLTEIVEPGKNGFLLPPGDLSEVERAVEDLIDDPRKRTSMGLASRKRFEEHFTADRMVDQTIAVLKEVCKR